ncbi:MAG: sigma-70 family RNA polymerase sigma factor, partial [Clostridia bacterium]|nr:sigma-70 family RNA polymerase sigma factor [Clostridia bacterium]
REMQSARARRYVNTLLDDRERQIILLRYGLSGKAPMTQREIAWQLGISRSYVSRLEKSALDKLRKAVGE